jgi:primosomal protein N' (replication factor Y)
LPEIALSAQWLERFRARFGGAPAEWHSELTPATRRTTWRAVAEGRVRVVVGARSALFLPFSDLGVIVVDEEHDAAFKQEDGVPYNARDMAVVRGRYGAIPVVLASATPSLETVVNVRNRRYADHHLPDRHGAAVLPDVRMIDMRAEKLPSTRWLSASLIEAVEAAKARGEQTLLFLNRRGYAPLTLCRACGHRWQCPRCTAWLVEHRRGGRLQCHHCDFSIKRPSACPECGAEETLAACGPGVERLAEEVEATFPGIRYEVASSDTLQGPNAAAALVRRIENREIDLVIGTQIVAKGYHFPMLTLVGVIDADLGLSGGDLRAAERTYQLLYQVAGRAGRAERPGRVLMQTYQPGHPVMAALISGSRDQFLSAEIEAREAARMPPFGRLAAVIVSGRDAEAVDRTANDLGRQAPRGAGLEVLGPAPAPFALLRGRHRRRLLLKARKDINVQAVIRRWLGTVRVPSKIRIQIDIDPYSFL